MTKRHRMVRLGSLLFLFGLGITLIAGSAQPVGATDVSCSCVAYVRSQTGLPGGPQYAKDYPSQMGRFGYREVGPQGGAIMIWEANQKGAYGQGHMAIVNGAQYDSRRHTWTITVRDANWVRCGIRTRSFTWGDVRGVHFYVKR